MDSLDEYKIFESAMKFARVEMLFLIWIVPVLFLFFLWGTKKRDNILSRFASPRGLKSILPDVDKRRLRLKAGLILLSLLLVAIALAGPQYGCKWQKIERAGVDIIIALDCSKSMLASDIKPTRLEHAKRKIYDLLSMLQGDRIGLVAFAGTAFLQSPLTLDYGIFRVFLQALTPEFLPLGGTNIPDAINTAISALDAKTATEKAIILITDGDSTTGDPMAAARNAQKLGIKLFAIGVGSKDGAPMPDEQGGFKKDAGGNTILARLDEETLKRITALTDGIYVHSLTGDLDIDTIYKKNILRQMKLSTLAGDRRQIWEDRYQWFLLPAIIALAAELFISERKKVIIALLVMGLPLLSVRAEAASIQQLFKDGIAAYEKGDYPKALKLFIEAQINEPDRPEIYYNIGNTYYKSGKYNAARESYREALKGKDDLLREKTFYNMGNAAFRMENLAEAKSDYEAALKINPLDFQAQQNLAYVKKELEKKQNQQKEQRHMKNGDLKGDQKGANPDAKQKAESKKKAEATKISGLRDLDPKPADSNRNQRASRNESSADFNKAPGTVHNQTLSYQLLNRLQDLPGRAMIPLYQKRQVEKDW
ncbi:MAG: VWA domain-containing protein [Syntrophales bacterium]